MTKFLLVYYSDEENYYYDISTPLLENKLYTHLYKTFQVKKYMKNVIKENEEINPRRKSLKLVYRDNCDLCNKTGKLALENSKYIVTCPKCNNSEMDFEGEERYKEIIANFQKAEKGDPKAIKLAVEDYLEENNICYIEEINITKLK